MDTTPSAVVTSSSSTVESANGVLFVINDLDPEPSPSNMLLKHPMGIMNIQDLHLLATANLIAQTQETIAQQYNMAADQESERSLSSESWSSEAKVKDTRKHSPSAKKPVKRKQTCSDQRSKDDVIKKKAKIEDIERPGDYVCSHCNLKLETAAELKNHYKQHNTMECSHPGCDRKFTWPSHLKYHELTHMERRKFCCDADGCEKLFYTSQQLEVHRRTHSKSKPYSCQQCNKSFTTAGNLRNHMRSHTGEKPFVCDSPDCGKRFAELSSLKKHKVTHTGQKPFECELCGKTFTQSSSRKVHMKSHLEGKKKKEDKSKPVNNDDTKLASSEGSQTDSFVELPIETELTRIGNSEIIQTDIDQNNCPNEILEVHIQESLADPSGRIDIIVVPVEAEAMLNSLVDQSCVNDTLNEPP